jgi:hypothetical protein
VVRWGGGRGGVEVKWERNTLREPESGCVDGVGRPEAGIMGG